MLDVEARKELAKQGYRIVGEHSAVKTCGWTKNMIKNKGGCYKLKFYGIMSNQCMQMTTSLSCANRCTFCWRGYKAPVSKEWQWNVNDPKLILENSLIEHHKLLVGFKGDINANKTIYENSLTVKHVALSLTGEPIIYPKMNELLDLFDKQGISTFLVTNAQYPEQIKNLNDVTQLYLSLDAPNKELLKKVDLPLFTDYWERLNQSLEYLAKKNHRTAIRLTLIKNINDIEPENYAKLILKGNPDFIEIKSYMHVGPSTERLKKENMLSQEEIVRFTTELLKYLPDYEFVDEHIPSRVTMIAHKRFKINDKWYTWIDFERYAKIRNNHLIANKLDYVRLNPFVNQNNKKNNKLVYENNIDSYEELEL